MTRVDIAEAPARLDELVEAAMLGEEVILTRDGRDVVALAAVAQVPRRRRQGFLRGPVWIADDFDAPLPEGG